jgi:hypothetical protein
MIDGGGASRRNARFADVCFDGDNHSQLQNLVRAPGYGYDQWTFERCWFRNFNNAHAFGGEQITRCKFVDCLFSNQGNASGVGIKILDGASDIDIIGCTFDWLALAAQFATSPGPWPQGISQRIRFIRNQVRQDWWAIKAHADANAVGSGAGGTLSFTATSLTDTSKSFPGTIPADSVRTIRVMQQLRSSTTTQLGQTILQDSAATFTTLGVAYGDIIRTANEWTTVVATIDDTALEIDGWRSLSTYLPRTAPSSGTSYKLYRVYTGETGSYTSTVITTPRWRDMLGNSVTPVANANTLYEILGNRSVGGLVFSSDVRDCIIADNVFHGGWSDQITLTGERHLITNNVAVWGQDMGMNLRASGSVVSGGQYSYNGARGIVNSDGDDIVISGVTCVDNATENVSTAFGCDIQIEGDRTVVEGCTLRRTSAPNDQYGIYVRAGASSVRVFDNNINGHYRQIGAADDVVNLTVRVLYDVSGPPASQFYPKGPVTI